MRIALNSMNITPNAVGGGETYFLGFLNALSHLPTPHQFTLLAHPEFHIPDNIPFASTHFNDTRNRRRMLRLFNLVDYVTHIPSLLRHTPIYEHYDIIHWVNGQMRPDMFNHRARRIVTFLDAQHIVFPEFFTPSELRSRAYIWRDSVKRADHIIAISHFAKQQIVEHYHIHPDKVSVIHLGVNQNAFHRTLDANTQAQIRAHYQLPKHFLYYPASTWAHKNHSRLLAAFASLIARGHDDIRLVLSGVKKGLHDRILGEIEQLSLGDHIQHIGFAEWDHIPALYQMATGVIFPSLFEGFGLPVIEAMACGTPVASSNIDVLQEIGGDVVHYFDAQDTESIAEAILYLWNVNATHLRDNLQHHASQYSWVNNAKQTLDVYNQVYKL